LNRALYPPIESRRVAARGPKCPAFKSKDSVLERPNDETAGPATVSPGAHAFAGAEGSAGYSVVWWDPGELLLDKKPSFGVRREDLIVKDVPRNVVTDGRSRYDRWQLARFDARAIGSTPSLVVETVRELTASGRPLPELALDPADISVMTVEQADRGRPGGAAFGALVHAVLAIAAFDATRSMLQDLVASEGRGLGAKDEEVAAAVGVIERVLAHTLLQRAGAAAARGACRRESPVTWSLADGTLVEGVVDLAFEEDGRWIVVDYKTDRELADLGEEQYRRQVALYATAIARATGQTTTGVLVRV
jgi:ATP-dependent exoDNAse (exonuclease V) beta subunit